MTDVTIPAEDAKRLADYLRNFHFHGMSGEQDRLIALLDPPTPSLRDDLAAATGWPFGPPLPPDRVAEIDAVLAVVRRHVEGLPSSVPGGALIPRSDVLRLLGGAE